MMLPLAGSPQLTVLGREVRLGSGYADLLAVESTGRLVIIEVKLAENAESRRAVVAQLPPARQEILARLADWADTLERGGLVRLATYRGKSNITTLLPRLVADDAGLVSIYCDNGSAYLQFWRSVFERRAPCSIPVVEAALGTQLKQGNTTHEFSDLLLEALTGAYREAVETATTTGMQTDLPTG